MDSTVLGSGMVYKYSFILLTADSNIKIISFTQNFVQYLKTLERQQIWKLFEEPNSSRAAKVKAKYHRQSVMTEADAPF